MGGRLAVEQVIEDGNTSGFDVERTWLATNDARTRDSHRELNGCDCLMKYQLTSAFPKTCVFDGSGRTGARAAGSLNKRLVKNLFQNQTSQNSLLEVFEI